MGTISSADYYSEYYGHRYMHLDYLTYVARLRALKIIWLVGDSTLDNKYWIEEKCAASNIYSEILSPPISKMDVCTCINAKLPNGYVCINAAVEEATLSSKCTLNASDRLVTLHTKHDDICVVSIGGNDVALRPSMEMLAHLGAYLLQQNSTSLNYLVQYFKKGLTDYIVGLNIKNVLICWMYYPDVHPTASWCSTTLNAMGYTSNPRNVQHLIQQIYTTAVATIQIEGVQVSTLPLYEILDGTDTTDYVQRVEPSASGGAKLAAGILQALNIPKIEKINTV